MENVKILDLQICLHPLVIMNISEHYTRIKAQNDSKNLVTVIGAILGTQMERSIDVLNSFEIISDVIESSIIVDKEYVKIKESHVKEVFPQLEFIGWYYCSDSESEKENIAIHKQISELYENPLFLKMSPKVQNNELPVNIYESFVDFSHGEANLLFREVTYILETEEAERVGLEHIANVNINDTSTSMIYSHMNTQQNAIKALNIRIQAVIDYLDNVKNGVIPGNEEIIPEAKSLINRLPLYEGDSIYKNEMNKQRQDISTLTYLGQMSRTCETINQVVNKVNTIHENKVESSSRRIKGLLP